MKKSIVMAFLMLAAFAGTAFADGIEECEERCKQQLEACLAQTANLANEIEIQEAKSACDSAQTACSADCQAQQNPPQSDPPPVQTDSPTNQSDTPPNQSDTPPNQNDSPPKGNEDGETPQ